MPHGNQSTVKGFLAGAIGGVIGTFLLNSMQKASIKGPRAIQDKLPAAQSFADQQQQLLEMFTVAHVKTAGAVAGSFGHNIDTTQHEQAAMITEFAFGTLCAGIYGAVAEYLPNVTVGFGTAYGAILFMGASEIVLPAIGFVPTPSARTAAQHVGGLGGNVAYGAVTEGVRRLLRSEQKQRSEI